MKFKHRGIALTLLSLFAVALPRVGVPQLLRQAMGIESSRERVPILNLERAEHDFGVVGAGQTLRAEFPVRNSGSRRLILHEEDCCSEGVTTLVNAGEQSVITLTLVTQRRPGPMQRDVHFTTSDPSQPKLTLTLRSVVE
jgi:hypothetical protein